MQDNSVISVIGARTNNLKNISVNIPKGSLVVITGPSGSGKSSLAFDTLFAEGQRRFLESLSLYSRQFLDMIEPPDVDKIFGLTPAIAIDQKNNSHNPRSTVGTATELYDLLRVLFTQCGVVQSDHGQSAFNKISPEALAAKLINESFDSKIIVLASFVENEKFLENLKKKGFTRGLVKGEVIELDQLEEKRELDGVIIDRLVACSKNLNRLEGSIRHCFELTQGHCKISIDGKLFDFYRETQIKLNESVEKFPEIESRLFSFNSSYGACTLCNGIGKVDHLDEKTIIANDSLSIFDGAIPLLNSAGPILKNRIENIFDANKIPLKTAWSSLKIKFKSDLLNGIKSENFPGIINYFSKIREISKTDDDLFFITCPRCLGRRLNHFALMIKLKGLNIAEICDLDIDRCYDFFQSLSGSTLKSAEKIHLEILSRLKFLNNVGLSYLNLSRPVSTLSGGEAQRIKLASQLGSSLSGITYILDEPTIGLHPVDNERLIRSIKELKDLKNNIIVVEHDKDTIMAADYLIDIGPGAGSNGGYVIAEGKIAQFLKNQQSVTAKYLAGEILVADCRKRNYQADNSIIIKGCSKYNIRNQNFLLPLNCLIGIVGASGSGKSTLIHEILVPALKMKNLSFFDSDHFESIETTTKIENVIELDQSAIGRSPKSNPATFTGIFDLIRDVFANQSDSKLKGYTKSRFSFNVKEGRCEECEGNGKIRLEVHFLPDVFVTCSICKGKRYNSETLSIKYKNYTINDVLNLSITEAADVFKNYPRIMNILRVLIELGLGYMKLGQSSTSISGGEAQRLKLAKELGRNPRGHTLYIFDEPTTGLHFQDIKLLIVALHKLVDKGNSVIVIEHNIDIIKSCDYLVEMGPEGGKNGGQNMFSGPLQDLKKFKKSRMAKYLV